jgi:phage major head subunit gpT-like protein
MGQFSDLESNDIIGNFFPRYEEELAGSWIPRLAVQVDSDKETENYKWIGQSPAMREWIGPRHQEVLNRFSFSITNSKYEGTLRFDKDDLRRDSTGQLNVRIGEMAQRAALHAETLASTLIIAGDTSTGLCYDGQQFFDTDHAESGSNQTNDLTATEIPSANVGTATAPTASEASNIIAEAIGYMLGYTDDKGEPINGQARRFLVMVGTSSLWSAFSQAATLSSLASGADNPVGGITASGMSVSVIYNPRLSANTTSIAVFREDGVGFKPLIHQVEVPLETQLQGSGSGIEFSQDAHQFGVKTVHAVGYGAWQQAQEITLS